MARIIHLSAAAMPSAGALLGTRGSSVVMDHINEGLSGSAFFGSINDRFANTYNHFIQNVVKPIRDASMAIADTVTTLMQPDLIRPITELEQLSYIPPSMYLPILLFEPVKDLLKQGRISGFGFEYENLPQEDVFGRLINNGVLEDVGNNCDAEGNFTLNYDFNSEDPEVSFDDLEHIDRSRKFILSVLESTDYDVTSYPENRS